MIIISSIFDKRRKDDKIYMFNKTNRNDLKKDVILSNNNLSNSENFVNEFDFYSNQEYYLFYKDENGKTHKELQTKIRVRVEVEKWYIHNKYCTY